MNKKEVAAALDEIATLLELTGENPFKVRSYVNGARQIERLTDDIGTVVQERRLREIPGIGQALEEKIIELVTTGHLVFLDELRSRFPATLPELFHIPGLGPKRAKQLYEELKIDSLEKLAEACANDALLKVKGFSAKMQAKIVEGIAFSRKHSGQHLAAAGHNAAALVYTYLHDCPGVQRLDIAGSLRRRKEVIKDIDLVASSRSPSALMERFVANPEVLHVTGNGPTKSSIVLKNGIACDLRVVDDAEFPFALMHFTGSKEHNVVMRQRAKDRKLKLNEYGLFREDESRITCKDETAIYKELGLPFIPPELREDRGEFALTSTPRLLEPEDLQGVVHCHTVYSDGVNTAEEMARAVRKLGYKYIVICDHSQTAAYANGLKPDRVLKQFAEIDALNKTLKGIRILKGIESDILADGSLDYEDELLAQFEFIVASVHSKLEMGEAEATKRVIAAVSNPYIDVLGHPTGRLLLRREGYPLNWDAVFDACAANKVAIEINANPHRLDIDWRHIHRGKEKGVRFSIGPDAHGINGFDCIPMGVGIARKGGLERGDVINTMNVKELMAWRKKR